MPSFVNTKSILIVRRDNIGDLVCTTPLIHALRQKFPNARIDALVNSYNEPVLAFNPDLNNVYAYTKAKHRDKGETVLGVHLRRLRLMLELRRQRYDLVVLANGGYLKRPLRLAKWIAPRNTIGFVPKDVAHTGIDQGVPMDSEPSHEVENLFRLLGPLGIEGPPPGLCLIPDSAQGDRARALLKRQSWYQAERRTLAIHISARKVMQRWPAERFSTLMRKLHEEHQCQFLLFWSPGDENNPLHPGDDRKAQSILDACHDLPVMPYPTLQLAELIGGLAVCDAMICSDGGAMHVGAALGLPIVSFFGNSDARTWHPWGVPHEVLQKPSHKVEDISVNDAAEAFTRLAHEILLCEGSRETARSA